MAGNDNKTAMSGNQRCNCMERHQQTFTILHFLIDGKTILENENWLKGSFGNTWNYRQGQVLKTMSEGGDAMCQQTATIEAILKFFWTVLKVLLFEVLLFQTSHYLHYLSNCLPIGESPTKFILNLLVIHFQWHIINNSTIGQLTIWHFLLCVSYFWKL